MASGTLSFYQTGQLTIFPSYNPLQFVGFEIIPPFHYINNALWITGEDMTISLSFCENLFYPQFSIQYFFIFSQSINQVSLLI